MNTPENFHSGKVADHLNSWRQLTSDRWILQQVAGIEIEFMITGEHIPDRKEIRFSSSEDELVANEVAKLVEKQIVQEVDQRPDQLLSSIFLRQKKDGSQRVILNLKNLNQTIEKIHFKMDTLKNAVSLMKKDCFFASVDLKDAYFSIRIAHKFRKYFRFQFHGKTFEFLALPQGYRDSPRIFTKLLKPVLAHLRLSGHTLLIYIDDTLLQGDTFEECQAAVLDTCALLDRLGFTVHPVKSVFTPTQCIEFLGFQLDSQNMLVSLTPRTVDKIRTKCADLAGRKKCTIRQLAEVIGYLVAAQPGVWVAPLFFKRLEIAKNEALAVRKGDFDAELVVSEQVRSDLLWWIDNVKQYPSPVSRGIPTVIVKSDASKIGWGAECQGSTTGGMWTKEEAFEHINCLELKAAYFALKSLCRGLCHSYIQLLTDNSTTVACINNMGSTKVLCNDIARDIWLWCLSHSNCVTATHLPGCLNIEADAESRVDRHNIEWHLDTQVFAEVINRFGLCDVDLFASRVNAQLRKYVSWKPDPDAFAIDAFSLDWSLFKAFCFPPFSLIPRVLQRIEVLEAECVLVVPLWTTQVWFTKLLRLLVELPVMLPRKENLLSHPLTGEHHPLLKKMKLVACSLSGQPSRNREFRMKQQTLSCQPGERVRSVTTSHISNAGFSIALNGIEIPFVPLHMS